jgi:transposase
VSHDSRSGRFPKPEKFAFDLAIATVLEARCRSPVTLQRDLKRARIVLLA